MRIYRGKDKYTPENGKHNNTHEYGKKNIDGLLLQSKIIDCNIRGGEIKINS